ncbi:hypothetical protein F383_08442 [Gossypium arboreum]|uniref:Uncharacterized protein n=1 Tax=Gossypium arboreum TaxID=29729 RepID=A0A0B0PED2_GOSAR|nr:hypothetical protein F383_08442 [Gossypium arboreum]
MNHSECQRPRRGLTCNHISMPLFQPGSYLHTYIGITYRCHGLTYTSHIRILCHDICILTIPKSKQIQKYSSQACMHSAIVNINSHISFQHI